MWYIDKEVLRKTTRVYNIDVMTAQLEVLTKKLNKLTQNASMVHQPTLVYVGYVTDYTIASCPLAFTHVYGMRRSVIHRTFRDNKIILTPTPIIQVGASIRTFHRLIIRNRDIKFRATYKNFSRNWRTCHLWMIY